VSRAEDLAAVAKRLFETFAPGADLATIELPDQSGICVLERAKGGGKIYVAPDESVLFVGSATDFYSGLEEFRAGNRTPPEFFATR